MAKRLIISGKQTLAAIEANPRNDRSAACRDGLLKACSSIDDYRGSWRKKTFNAPEKHGGVFVSPDGRLYYVRLESALLRRFRQPHQADELGAIAECILAFALLR